MKPVSNKLGENEYYHGTWGICSLQIMYEGYRFKQEWSGWGKSGAFKAALYLTKSLGTAASFGTYIWKCEIKDGVRLLRLNDQYDPKVIRYLKREFGKELLDGDISKSIPKNKHLTNKELIHLLNYRRSKGGGCTGQWTEKTIRRWYAWVDSIRKQVLIHGYDGVGDNLTVDGLAIFNPSLVIMRELYCPKYIPEKEKHLLYELDKSKFISEIKKEIDDHDGWDEARNYDHISELLKRYCKEKSLPIP